MRIYQLLIISKKLLNIKSLGYCYVFESLLCSGIRIDELTSINFKVNPMHRGILNLRFIAMIKQRLLLILKRLVKSKRFIFRLILISSL